MSYIYRAGDVVHHEPTGEDWVVAYCDGERLAWCGWPEGEAEAKDCWLKKSCTDEEHVKQLREIAKSSGKRARMAKLALEKLEGAPPMNALEIMLSAYNKRLAELSRGSNSDEPIGLDDIRRICLQASLSALEAAGMAVVPRERSPADVIQHIGKVAVAVGWQAGVGASETAGMIISCLLAKPELIDRFLSEGVGLLVDGDIGPDQGCLTFHRKDGKVTTPEELRMARAARRMLIDAGALPAAPSTGDDGGKGDGE